MPSPSATPPRARQPVHTLYGGAHLFRYDSAQKMGRTAAALANSIALTGADFADLLGASGADGDALLARVQSKLEREPVEDFRIDFEDGYGTRSALAEDADTARCAVEVAKGHVARSLPPFIGLRIKSLADATRGRALRTLTQFVASWAPLTRSFAVPCPLRITLPKVQHAREVELLHATLQALCAHHQLDFGHFQIELMIETPNALHDESGRVPLGDIVRAARGKCVGLHFGAYDYLSALGVAGPAQSLHHTYCHDARITMLKAATLAHIEVVDGATTQLPMLLHKQPQGPGEHQANRHAVLGALATHGWDVAVSLGHGFYQSWDLHPGQLLSRYGATYAFFQEGLPATLTRMRTYLQARERAGATASGAFDDAATVRGHAEFLLRGLQCHALEAPDLAKLTQLGLTEFELSRLAARS